MGSILGLGRSPGGGHGKPLQYSCLENPMDRGAWQAIVHRVTKSRTQLRDWAHTHTPTTLITQNYKSTRLQFLKMWNYWALFRYWVLFGTGDSALAKAGWASAERRFSCVQRPLCSLSLWITLLRPQALHSRIWATSLWLKLFRKAPLHRNTSTC